MTMTTDASGAGPGVSGPEGELDWDVIDWAAREKIVRRLRRRIFAAVRDGDMARATSLQKLLLASRSNALVSVRQVTQRNVGRRTAGIDGEVALTSPARAKVALEVIATKDSWCPVPVRRVYIPKPGSAARACPIDLDGSFPVGLRRG